MYNRLHNVNNPNQGPAKKVLCLCSAGLLRSPTAAVVLQREYGFNTRAAGLAREYALIPVDEVLIEWADEVVVMENWMHKELETNRCINKLICLSIPDKYPYMDPVLQTLIKEAYERETNG